MKNNDEKKTLVERHAMKRLHQVEKDRRKTYVKQPHKTNYSQIVMGALFVIILAFMFFSMFKN